MDIQLVERCFRLLDLVVLVDGGPKHLEDDLDGQRRDIEIVGHQAVGHLASFAGDRIGKRRQEASDAVMVDVALDSS